jgi:cyclophilin family peptidyl-prolyl cis-trans isomerase
LVDKPRRRVEKKFPVAKVAAVVIVVIVVAAVGYFVYSDYIYQAPPVYARIVTTDGGFDVVLYPACAPQTVANFVSLVNSGFYDGLVWHRIVKGFVIQTGDPATKGGLNSTRSTWGSGGSNMTVPLEVSRCSWIGNYEGYLGMARSQSVDSGSSQFYINLSNSSSNLSLNGNYTAFGKVIDNMSVVQALGNSPICQPPTCPSAWPADEPLPPVFVNSIVILPGNPETTTT